MKLDLKKKWSNGVGALVFPPGEFIERIASLIPRPHKCLITFRGLLAPNHRLRPLVVLYSRPPGDVDIDSRYPASSGQARKRWAGFPPDPLLLDPLLLRPQADGSACSPPGAAGAPGYWSVFSHLLRGLSGSSAESPSPDTPSKPVYRSWAWALHRAFDVDPLKCTRPGCQGRLRFVAFVTNPEAIGNILRSLGIRAPGAPSAAVGQRPSRAPPRLDNGPLFDRAR